MDSGCGTPRPGKRKRWTLGLVLCLIALVVGAAVARPLWLRASRKDPARLDMLYAAWTEFNAKRYDGATALLNRRAAEVTPTSLDWMLRARIAESQGRLVEALDHLKHISDSDPFSAQAWLKAGQIELERNRSVAAEAAYRRALAIDPNKIQPYRELAYLYALQRRKAECDAQFRALDERLSMNYVLAFAWCQNFCDIWDPYGPRKVLSGFIAEDRADRWSRLALGASFRLTHEFDEAIGTLAALPDSDPDARALRAQIAIDRGEIAAAEELVQGGSSEHVRLNDFRGQLALLGSDPHKAAEYFRAALRQDPDDRDAIQGLGLALRKLGDPEAKEFLQIAYRHDQLRRTIQDSVTTLHSDPKLFFKLGELCESLHRLSEARVWYRLAIGRDPLDTQAQQNLARVDRNALEKNAEATRKLSEHN